jgi:hypothetical protein
MPAFPAAVRAACRRPRRTRIVRTLPVTGLGQLPPTGIAGAGQYVS